MLFSFTKMIYVIRYEVNFFEFVFGIDDINCD